MTLAPRSILFVSGETPARFAKATNAGADLVCLDLEDAVHPERKATARQANLDFVAEQRIDSNACALAVRVNAFDTPAGLNDLQALASSKRLPDVVVLPKVEHAPDIAVVRSWFGHDCPKPVAPIARKGHSVEDKAEY